MAGSAQGPKDIPDAVAQAKGAAAGAYVKIGLEDELLETVKCVLCARCKELCPRGVDTRSLRIAIHQHMVSRQKYPQNLNLMKEAIDAKQNDKPF